MYHIDKFRADVREPDHKRCPNSSLVCWVRMFGSCSTVATICVLCEILGGRKKFFFTLYVRFQVDRVDLNVSINNTLKRIVSGEDDNILTHSAAQFAYK